MLQHRRGRSRLRVVTALENETIRMLVAGEPSGLELAPPGLVDWEDIDHFAHSFSTAHRFADLRIADYVELLADAGKLAELSVDTIRHQHRVHAEDTSGNPAGSWSVFECLDGELRVGGETYLLVGGRFYKVAESYRKELDEFIDKMNEWSGVLPDSTTAEPEGAYNERAANSSVEYLNMDKALVRVGHHTNAIEFCDIYTSDGDFVHVKRHLRSNMLSHLFAQGSVAGDLFLMSAEYRDKSLAVVREKEQDRATRTGDPSYVGRFSTFDTGEIVPARFEVVYAIVAEWRGRPYREALPFFSKVNLRRRVNELTRMGYRVSLKRVEAR